MGMKYSDVPFYIVMILLSIVFYFQAGILGFILFVSIVVFTYRYMDWAHKKDREKQLSNNISISKERIRNEWRTWNEVAEKLRFQTKMNVDDYVMIKTAQEVRNVIARILLGEFKGDNFETSKEKAEKLLRC